eukprot:TRINITY_DN2838_c0_g1_i1.p1 TRINITY_DN2838_c0_g1~~TRINITY_DN2838_c0_g1_i1.p1  ORF type:complete len:367 (-),score=26.48 TRINITY_DN2838_c0_g1_i1:27-1127(-)
MDLTNAIVAQGEEIGPDTTVIPFAINKQTSSARFYHGNSTPSLFAYGSWGEPQANLSIGLFNVVDGNVVPSIASISLPNPRSAHDTHDVTDIQVVDGLQSSLVASLSDGRVAFVFLSFSNQGEMKHDIAFATKHIWHTHTAPVSSVAVLDLEWCVSAGEDGKLCVYQFGADFPHLSTIEYASALYDVCDLSHHSGMAVTATSKLLHFDLRTTQKTLSSTFRSGVALTSVCRHERRTEVLATGSADGDVATWDLRNLSQPTAVLSELPALSHTRYMPVWEVQFMSDYASLAAVGEDGLLQLWNFNQSDLQPQLVGYSRRDSDNFGLSTVLERGMPLNSFDYDPKTNCALVSSDDHHLYFLPSFMPTK